MNEKNVLKMLQREEKSRLVDFIVHLEATFVDHENINFMLEFLPGQDLFWLMQNEMNLFLGKQKSAAG